MNAIMQAMMLMSQNSGQQRLQGQREFLGDRNRHLDISGNLIDPYANKNPFDNGFFNSSASQLSPEHRAQSQGGNAMNQWNYGMNGVAAPQQSAAEGAMGASPAPFMPSSGQGFRAPAPLTSPMGNAQTDAANLQQSQQMYAPGGFKRPQPQRPRQGGYTPSWNPTVPGARMA